MNNKMAIDTYLLDTYLSTNESKKQTKQTRTDRIMDMENVLMVAIWEGDMGK